MYDQFISVEIETLGALGPNIKEILLQLWAKVSQGSLMIFCSSMTWAVCLVLSDFNFIMCFNCLIIYTC